MTMPLSSTEILITPEKDAPELNKVGEPALEERTLRSQLGTEALSAAMELHYLDEKYKTTTDLANNVIDDLLQDPEVLEQDFGMFARSLASLKGIHYSKASYVEIQQAVDEALLARSAEIAAAQEQRRRQIDALAEEYLEKRLNYADVLGDEARSAEQVPGARANAEMLARLHEKGRWSEVEIASRSIRDQFEEVRSLLPEGVELSIYADSESWILWDIAKQERLKDEPLYTESGVANMYKFLHQQGSVLRNSFPEGRRETIVDRHLGWEIFQLVQQGESIDWLLRGASSLRGELNEMLREMDSRKPHSYQFTRLGEITRYVLEDLEHTRRNGASGR